MRHAYLNVAEEGRAEDLDRNPHEQHEGADGQVLWRTERQLHVAVAAAQRNDLRDMSAALSAAPKNVKVVQSKKQHSTVCVKYEFNAGQFASISLKISS
jgi:hypothetical protein